MTKFPTAVKAVFAAFFLSLALWAGIFHGKLPAVTDVFLYTYPSQSVNLMEWSKGSLPLWDAFTGCGMPQLANSLSACFYPPFWLWHSTGLSHWIVWISLLHSAWAFLGFYFWARSVKIFPLWAALGALSFAGSLHMVRCWGYPVFSASQAWTPWIFFAAARFLERGRPLGWIALALAAGAQILAGYPFFSFYTLLLLAGWAAAQPAPPFRKPVLFTALGFAFAGSAAHWLPFVDFLGYATRGSWGAPDKFPFFSKPAEYLTLLSPTLLGMPETPAYGGTTANAAFMLYFGLIPLAAWVGGSFLKNNPGRRFWGIAAGVWLLWLMGPRLPLWGWAPESWLEALNPSKAVGVFIFAACTSAGLTLTRFFRDPWNEKARSLLSGVVGFCWLLDILLIPVRVVHPVPDPYQKKEIKNAAVRVQAACGGQRLVSLHARQRDVFHGREGDSRVFEEAADGWVEDFLVNSNAVWGIRSAHAYLSLWPLSMDKLWKAFNQPASYNSRLADAAGVGAVALPLELPPAHYQVLEKREDQFLARNLFCGPDFAPALTARTLANQDAVVEALLREPGGPGKGKEIFLEEGVALPLGLRSLSNVSQKAGADRPSGSRASFGGDFPDAGWLFWDEAYSPGWRAWVDGKPAAIHRADGFFMAVPVLVGGFHRLDFRYESASFRFGLFLSFICFWLGLAGLGLRLQGRRES